MYDSLTRRRTAAVVVVAENSKHLLLGLGSQLPPPSPPPLLDWPRRIALPSLLDHHCGPVRISAIDGGALSCPCLISIHSLVYLARCIDGCVVGVQCRVHHSFASDGCARALLS